jgi:hypothetical protein
MVLVRVHSVGWAGRLSLEQDDFIFESSSFAKPVPTFAGHALSAAAEAGCGKSPRPPNRTATTSSGSGWDHRPNTTES